MTSAARALLLTPLLLLTSAPASAAEEKGDRSPSLDLGCAVARAVGFESVCLELRFFQREDERRMGEELVQLLDSPAASRARKIVEAELAEKPAADGKPCPPARPLCTFARAALAALKEGLGPEPKK